jgi:hypothetical protein
MWLSWLHFFFSQLWVKTPNNIHSGMFSVNKIHLTPHIQSDHKKTPQLISLLFEIRFQQEIHQIKGFKKYCIFRCYSNF